MNTESFYYKVFEKKISDELLNIISNPNIEDDKKLISIHILEVRGELNDDIAKLRIELSKKLKGVLTNDAATDKYNTFWLRLFANLIDSIILSFLGFLIRLITKHDSITTINFLAFISILIPYFYSILFHGFTGQTIGKMITGVKIYDKSENNLITLKHAVLRDIIPFLGILIMYFLSLSNLTIVNGYLTKLSLIIMLLIWSWSLLEIITMLLNKKRRALHDFIAGTIVLKLKNA